MHILFSSVTITCSDTKCLQKSKSEFRARVKRTSEKCERPETKAADWLLQSHKPAERSVSSRRLGMMNLRRAFLGVERKVRPLATESAAN